MDPAPFPSRGVGATNPRVAPVGLCHLPHGLSHLHGRAVAGLGGAPASGLFVPGAAPPAEPLSPQALVLEQAAQGSGPPDLRMQYLRQIQANHEVSHKTSFPSLCLISPPPPRLFRPPHLPVSLLDAAEGGSVPARPAAPGRGERGDGGEAPAGLQAAAQPQPGSAVSRAGGTQSAPDTPRG